MPIYTKLNEKRNKKEDKVKTCKILTAKLIQLISSNKLKSLPASKFYKTIVKMSFIGAISSCDHDTNLHPCYRFTPVSHKNSTLF